MRITQKVPASSTEQTITIDIPDPVVTQGAAVVSITGTTPIPPVVDPPPPSTGTVINFSLDQIPLTDPDFVRNGAGANQFYGGNGSQTPLPGTSTFEYADNDQRFPWSQLQTGPATYNWKPLEDAIDKCIAAGQKLSFRIMTCDSDAGKSLCPSFVSTAKTPDFNAEIYISTFIAMITEMGKRLTSTGRIKGVYKFDISGIGNWGEMHWYGLPANTVMTAANVKRNVDATTAALPDTRLMVTISGLTNNSSLSDEAAYYLLMASNNLGKVGIRSDHLGVAGTFHFDTVDSNRKYNGVDFLTECLNRWTTSPVAGELMNSIAQVNAASPYSDIAAEIAKWHMSQFSNNNYCRVSGTGATSAQISASDINIRAASKAAGARIGLLSGTVKDTSLSLWWLNNGNAPVYEKYNVVFEIRNGSTVVWSGVSSFSPTGLLPGSIKITDTIGTAKGDLYVIVKEAAGVRKPLQLANKNRLADGSYLLTTIN